MAQPRRLAADDYAVTLARLVNETGEAQGGRVRIVQQLEQQFVERSEPTPVSAGVVGALEELRAGLPPGDWLANNIDAGLKPLRVQLARQQRQRAFRDLDPDADIPTMLAAAYRYRDKSRQRAADLLRTPVEHRVARSAVVTHHGAAATRPPVAVAARRAGVAPAATTLLANPTQTHHLDL